MAKHGSDVVHILYLTYDGLTSLIGQSQVWPYLKGLAAVGHQFDVVSFEHEERRKRIGNAVARDVAGSAINWPPCPFRSRPPILAKPLAPPRRIGTAGRPSVARQIARRATGGRLTTALTGAVAASRRRAAAIAAWDAIVIAFGGAVAAKIYHDRCVPIWDAGAISSAHALPLKRRALRALRAWHDSSVAACLTGAGQSAVMAVSM